MEMFAQRYGGGVVSMASHSHRRVRSYFSQNPDSIFSNGDTCYVLAFAIIMLNTDLHNPAIKKEKKMSKTQWQQHVRGINDGKDLPLDFVNDTYERIRTNEIKMESETNMFAGAGKKGYLVKQGGKIRTWKRRYFVLSDHQLLYFRKPTDQAPLGIIPLENLVVDREEKVVKNGFRLSSSDGDVVKAVRMMNGDIRAGNHTSYLVGASSAEECGEWIDLIQQSGLFWPCCCLLALTRAFCADIHRSPFYALLLKKKNVRLAQSK